MKMFFLLSLFTLSSSFAFSITPASEPNDRACDSGPRCFVSDRCLEISGPCQVKKNPDSSWYASPIRYRINELQTCLFPTGPQQVWEQGKFQHWFGDQYARTFNSSEQAAKKCEKNKADLVEQFKECKSP